MSSYEMMELTGITVFDVIVPPPDEEDDDPDAPPTPSSVTLIQIDDWVRDDSAVLRSMRGGERPEWQEMLAQVANETAVLRAVQAPKVDSDEYGSRIWLGNRKVDELIEAQSEVMEARESVFAMADVTATAPEPGVPGVEEEDSYGETDWEG